MIAETKSLRKSCQHREQDVGLKQDMVKKQQAEKAEQDTKNKSEFEAKVADRNTKKQDLSAQREPEIEQVQDA